MWTMDTPNFFIWRIEISRELTALVNHIVGRGGVIETRVVQEEGFSSEKHFVEESDKLSEMHTWFIVF